MIESTKLSLQITDLAINKVKSLIADETNPNLKLRVFITGGGCSGFRYSFVFDDKVNSNDIIIEKRGVVLVVDTMSMQYLAGGSVDYIEGIDGSRFVISNLNFRNTCGCGLSFDI